MRALCERMLAPPSLTLLAAALAALWPLTAYGVNRTVLPGLIALGAAAYIARQPAYGIAGAVALTPLFNLRVDLNDPGITLPYHPFKLALVVLAIGTLAVAILLHRSPGTAKGGGPLLGAIVVFAFAQFVSTLFAADILEGVRASELTLVAALLTFAIFQVCNHAGDGIVIAGGIVLGMVIASVLALDEAIAGTAMDAFWVGDTRVARVQGPFLHTNHLGGYLAIALPLAGVLALRREVPVPLRALGAAGLMLGLPVLGLTFSRGAIIALVGAGLVWLLLRGHRRLLAVGAAITIIGVFAMPSALRERFDLSSKRADASVRVDLWRSALDIAGQRPVLGVGPGNFQPTYRRLPSTPVYSSQRRLLDGERLVVPRHAHNHVLNQLAETGVLGLLAFAGLMLAAGLTVSRALRVRSAVGRSIATAAGIGLLAYLIEGFFDNAHPETIVLLSALLALAAVFIGLDQRSPPADSAPDATAPGPPGR